MTKPFHVFVPILPFFWWGNTEFYIFLALKALQELQAERDETDGYKKNKNVFLFRNILHFKSNMLAFKKAF